MDDKVTVRLTDERRGHTTLTVNGIPLQIPFDTPIAITREYFEALRHSTLKWDLVGKMPAGWVERDPQAGVTTIDTLGGQPGPAEPGPETPASPPASPPPSPPTGTTTMADVARDRVSSGAVATPATPPPDPLLARLDGATASALAGIEDLSVDDLKRLLAAENAGKARKTVIGPLEAAIAAGGVLPAA